MTLPEIVCRKCGRSIRSTLIDNKLPAPDEGDGFYGRPGKRGIKCKYDTENHVVYHLRVGGSHKLAYIRKFKETQ